MCFENNNWPLCTCVTCSKRALLQQFIEVVVKWIAWAGPKRGGGAVWLVGVLGVVEGGRVYWRVPWVGNAARTTDGLQRSDEVIIDHQQCACVLVGHVMMAAFLFSVDTLIQLHPTVYLVEAGVGAVELPSQFFPFCRQMALHTTPFVGFFYCFLPCKWSLLYMQLVPCQSWCNLLLKGIVAV